MGLKKTEDSLRNYNGYLNFNLFKWIIKNNLSIGFAYKVFAKLKLYSAIEVRDSFRDIVKANSSLFNSDNTYFTSFGAPDIIYKSGNRLIVEFRNTFKNFEERIIPIWKIPQLPKSSNIIFIDDIIGTGRQSKEYIIEISQLLNASHNAYLYCICGTFDGLKLINDNTSFKASAVNVLYRDKDYYTDKDCNYFSNAEKLTISEKIDLLKSRNAKYDLGLLIAFEYSIPNNSMPLLWKHGFKYNVDNIEKEWHALLPRDY